MTELTNPGLGWSFQSGSSASGSTGLSASASSTNSASNMPNSHPADSRPPFHTIHEDEEAPHIIKTSEASKKIGANTV